MNEERRIENIEVDKIIPNIYQPRIKFDNKSIEELSNSIKNHGIIQPLILRKIGEKYEIIDGERRYKAAKRINLEVLPSIVLDIEDKEAAELILTENMQKQLLTPIEEANAYQQMMLLNKFDIEELATKLDKNKNAIENKLKLLTLHPEIQEALLNNKISEGHARALTKVNSKKEQLNLFHRILTERIPVKTLEEIIINERNPFKTEKKNKSEVEFMDNSQLNFNQYNNLLKEQEKPQMEATANPSPILGNAFSEPKPNDFFPSLEEQPLNAEVPMGVQEVPAPMEMPQFEVPNMPVQEVGVMQPEITPVTEVPQNNGGEVSNIEVPAFEMPSIGAPESVVQPEIASQMAVPQMTQEMPAPVEMPQFEVPNIPAQEFSPVQPAISPVMEVPQNNVPEVPNIEMPAFEMPNIGAPEAVVQPEIAPQMEVPQMTQEMPAPVEMPQFEVPSMPAQEFSPVQPAVSPVMEVPQNNVVEVPSMEAPAFEMPNIGAKEAVVQPELAPQMEVPQMTQEMPAPVEMPQFEVPSMPAQEVTPMQPEITPVMEAQPAMTNVMPAVNIIRNLMPLLENSGYKIRIEESDNLSEYQVVIKVQK